MTPSNHTRSMDADGQTSSKLDQRTPAGVSLRSRRPHVKFWLFARSLSMLLRRKDLRPLCWQRNELTENLCQGYLFAGHHLHEFCNYTYRM